MLFLKFTGIDYDGDDAAGEKLDAFICWIQAALERYGASLVQVTFGDKGSYILMVFGAPVAHEDDTWRALSAALEFIHPPEHLDYISNIQVGVNRGLIFAGTYGGSGSLTYGVLGDATNVAARLMGWAKPGQILVPARLIPTTGVEFEFQEMGNMVMKGLMGPMSVASLEAHSTIRREVSGMPAGFAGGIVGRSSERVAAKESLNALGDGESLVLLIEGEAGIGKSQLVAEILEEARGSGFEAFVGNGDAVEQSSPYFAWRRIIRSALNGAISGHSNTITQDAVISRLQGLDPDLVRVAPLLNTILATDIPENDLTKSMSGEVRADNTNRLLASILVWRASMKPLVIVLDDAHWLDSASMSLARVVVRDVTPLLLVIAARPFDYASKDYEHLRQGPASRLLSLNLLSSDEILAIASRRLGVHGLPKPVADLILSKAEGHPFFGEELAFALRDTGLIRVQDGHAELLTTPQELEHLTFPDTIQGVITSRIDRVSAKEQLTLKVASVIGRIFAFHILRDIYPVDTSGPDLQQELGDLEKLDIMLLETPDPKLAYVFRHVITQEVTYGLLTFAQRKRLHRATAEWHEKQLDGGLKHLYPMLAYHWQRAEDPGKASHYLELAGIQALRNNANREAIRFFEELRELENTSDLGSDTLTKAKRARLMAEAYFGSGDIRKGQEYYEEALSILEQPLPRSKNELSLSLLREAARQTFHRLWPSRYVKPDQEDLVSLEAAHSYHGLAVIHYFDNNSLAFTNATLRALNLAEKSFPSRELAEGYATLCVISSFVPGLNISDNYAQMAVETADQLGEPSILGNVWLRISVYHSGVGHWTEARSAAQKAIANYELINDLRGWGDSMNALMQMVTIYGRFEEGAELSHELQRVALENDNPQHQDWGLWMEGKNLLRLGQIEDAIKQIEASIALEESAANKLQELHVYGALALASWYHGDAQKAVDSLRKIDISVAAETPGFATLSAISHVSETFLLAWEAGRETDGTVGDAELIELIDGAEQSCKAIKSYSRIFPIGKPAAQLYQGKLAWLKGNANNAFKAWKQCIALAEKLDMPYEQGRAAYELGLNLPDGATGRSPYLLEAIEIFKNLDAAGDMEHAQAALGQP